MSIWVVAQPAKDRSQSWPTGRVGTKGTIRNTWVETTFTSHVNIRAFAWKCCCYFYKSHSTHLPHSRSQHSQTNFRVCAAFSHHSSTYMFHFILTTHISASFLFSLPTRQHIFVTCRHYVKALQEHLSNSEASPATKKARTSYVGSPTVSTSRGRERRKRSRQRERQNSEEHTIDDLVQGL
jgi:hypothetical protein